MGDARGVGRGTAGDGGTGAPKVGMLGERSAEGAERIGASAICVIGGGVGARGACGSGAACGAACAAACGAGATAVGMMGERRAEGDERMGACERQRVIETTHASGEGYTGGLVRTFRA